MKILFALLLATLSLPAFAGTAWILHNESLGFELEMLAGTNDIEICNHDDDCIHFDFVRAVNSHVRLFKTRYCALRLTDRYDRDPEHPEDLLRSEIVEMTKTGVRCRLFDKTGKHSDLTARYTSF